MIGDHEDIYFVILYSIVISMALLGRFDYKGPKSTLFGKKRDRGSWRRVREKVVERYRQRSRSWP